MKKSVLIELVLLLGLAIGQISATQEEPKYVIFFIGDGMDFEQVEAAGMYANGEAGTLSFESFPYEGQLTTYSADVPITDSSAAATAMATGVKVNEGVIGMAYPGDGSELETMLEYFKAQSKSTGLVTTSYMTDATLAAFVTGAPEAWSPYPADAAMYVETPVTLSWKPGSSAVSHDVYFGEDFDDVKDGSGETFQGNQSSTSLLIGSSRRPLNPGTTYYWRVDEINNLHPDSPWKGDVWSFATLPDIAITDPSLVGWWKLDEGSGTTDIDWSGNGFNIRLTDTTWEDGVFGGAVHFHGVGYGYVDNFRYSDNAITVCAWVWHDAFRIGKIERYVTVGPSVTVIRKEADGRLHFYIKTDGNLRHLWVTDVLTEGQWHHVAGTWDGVTQRLYIDGVKIASQAPSGVLGDTSNIKMSLGGEPFNGMLDEVRIYNRVLTQNEIQVVMQRKESPFTFGPTPADGALHQDTWVNLRWFAGDSAASHDVYFGEDFDDVDASTGGTFQCNQTAALAWPGK